MSSRVHIDQPTADDEDAYRLAVRSSNELLHPWIWLTDSSESFAEYLERYQQDDQRAYLVREIESRQLVGFVNANNIVRGAFRSAFLGYGAFAGREGRGLMTEALTLVIDDLFGRVGLHRVEANIQPGNERSIRLVERLGFRKEGFSPDYLFIDGEWRDHERWALTSEMWDQRR
jgi:ribosomal-protein-alanine N-acetyltransferase